MTRGRSETQPAGVDLDRALAITYYKRFRMEIDLRDPLETPGLPDGFSWVPWEEPLLDRHAETKFRCFKGEVDAYIFPSLGDRHGCLRLMREIRRKPGFLPGATWLIAGKSGFIGTVQGVMDHGSIGAVQNVGVVAEYRGQGFGRALLQRALTGFHAAGLRKAYLEVTADNKSAVQLYRNVGFRKTKTLYKAVSG
jgi:GNAT superfamily N-acetyltransferase